MTPARPRPRAHAAVLVGVVAGVCLVAGLLVLGRGPGDVLAPTPRSLEPSATTVALRTLHGWDRSRSQAWAAGSSRGLRSLYLPGSVAGAADLRLLRRYHDRGVRVTGMRTQVLGLAVLRRTPGRMTLRVTDRLTAAVAVRRSGPPTGSRRRVVLPRDAATTRVLELRRGGDGRWRIGAVVDAVS